MTRTLLTNILGGTFYRNNLFKTFNEFDKIKFIASKLLNSHAPLKRNTLDVIKLCL